jgi:transcriptional regulator with XRE-family HTH domain
MPTRRDPVNKDNRPHFIPEWAQVRGKKQSDIVNGTGIDKGTVNRWFKHRTLPHPGHREKVAAFLGLTDSAQLFLPPTTDAEMADLKARLAEAVEGMDRETLRSMISMVEGLVSAQAGRGTPPPVPEREAAPGARKDKP